MKNTTMIVITEMHEFLRAFLVDANILSVLPKLEAANQFLWQKIDAMQNDEHIITPEDCDAFLTALRNDVLLVNLPNDKLFSILTENRADIVIFDVQVGFEAFTYPCEVVKRAEMASRLSRL